MRCWYLTYFMDDTDVFVYETELGMSICLVKVLSELYLTTRQTVRVLYSNSLFCHRFVNCMVWFYVSVFYQSIRSR